MKPLIIAHRGYSAKYTENTLPAFSAAIDSGCNMIELDVHFSHDNQLVVFHDLKLKRITRRKKRIVDYGADELKLFNIPTLKDVFELVDKRVPLNIEIKHETIKHSEYRKLMVKKLLMLIAETNMKEHVLISSFDDFFLRALRDADADISLGILDHNHPRQKLKSELIREITPYSYHPNQRALNELHMHLLKNAGLKVFAYTANEIRQFQRLCALGVDGIITNEVEQLHRYLFD
jgi:glycerophosphoryl diester phosphodiesterase